MRKSIFKFSLLSIGLAVMLITACKKEETKVDPECEEVEEEEEQKEKCLVVTKEHNASNDSVSGTDLRNYTYEDYRLVEVDKVTLNEKDKYTYEDGKLVKGEVYSRDTLRVEIDFTYDSEDRMESMVFNLVAMPKTNILKKYRVSDRAFKYLIAQKRNGNLGIKMAFKYNDDDRVSEQRDFTIANGVELPVGLFEYEYNDKGDIKLETVYDDSTFTGNFYKSEEFRFKYDDKKSPQTDEIVPSAFYPSVHNLVKKTRKWLILDAEDEVIEYENEYNEDGYLIKKEYEENGSDHVVNYTYKCEEGEEE